MPVVDLALKLQSSFGHRTPQVVREFLAEFFGIFVLLAVGNCAVAQSVLSGKNDFFGVTWGYSLGVFFGVLLSAETSGGHINPAVTVGLAVWGKFPWRKVPLYWAAQYLGAFTSGFVVYIMYYGAIAAYETEPSILTAGIWATYPGTVLHKNGTVTPFLTATNGFIDQTIGTLFLLLFVCIITDIKNKIPSYLIPFFITLGIIAIGMSSGMNSGYAINPARDLGPRLFTSVAGWGSLPFRATTVDGVPWWWIPVVAPHLGGILGVLLYILFIEMHHNNKDNNNIGKHTVKNNSIVPHPPANVEMISVIPISNNTKL